MALTYSLIASNTLSSSAANVTFSAIPATYTDLVLRSSVRGSRTGFFDLYYIELNSDTTALYSNRFFLGNGSTVTSSTASNSAGFPMLVSPIDTANATSSAFSSNEMYIFNYTSTANKQISDFGALENNATSAEMRASAVSYRNTSAITSIKLTPGVGTFDSGSSFCLYGIKNS
jgi:hypothetical protein